MNEKQRSKMVGILVEHQSEFTGLTTEEAQWVIRKPKSAITLFVRAIKNRESVSFPVWKTIQLGTGFKTGDEFREALKGGGFKISNWANGMTREPKFVSSISSVEKEVNLCVLTTEQIIGRSGTTAEVLAGIRKIGELLPAEAGPQLRLQYPDQPNDEWLFVAMEPMEDSDGGPDVFNVGRNDGGLWLDTSCDSPDCVWDPDGRWVFALRK